VVHGYPSAGWLGRQNCITSAESFVCVGVLCMCMCVCFCKNMYIRCKHFEVVFLRGYEVFKNFSFSCFHICIKAIYTLLILNL